MVPRLVKTNPGSAESFLLDYLSQGKSLSSEVRKHVTLSQGDIWALIPNEARSDQIVAFTQGFGASTLPQRTWVIQSIARLFLSMPELIALFEEANLTRSDLERGISERLHRDRNHGPPYGPHDDWRDPADKWWRLFPDNSVKPKALELDRTSHSMSVGTTNLGRQCANDLYAFDGEEVYLHVRPPDAEGTKIAEAMRSADNCYLLFGLLSPGRALAGRPDRPLLLCTSDLTELASNAVVLIFQAYDQEGYLIWLRSEFSHVAEFFGGPNVVPNVNASHFRS